MEGAHVNRRDIAERDSLKCSGNLRNKEEECEGVFGKYRGVKASQVEHVGRACGVRGKSEGDDPFALTIQT